MKAMEMTQAQLKEAANRSSKPNFMNTPSRTFDSEKFFLEYLNEYLTVEAIAEANGITVSQAEILINAGRQVNHKKAEKKRKADYMIEKAKIMRKSFADAINRY